MREGKIVSEAKTMVEAGEKVFQFVPNDRGWKGCSVLVEIEDENSAKGFHGSCYSKVVMEEIHEGWKPSAIYLCLAHFSTKATARKMVDDLRSGKITIAQALEKSVKSYERWVNSVLAGKQSGRSNGIGRYQLIYFGGTKEQIARLDAAEKAFSKHITDKMVERGQITAVEAKQIESYEAQEA